MTVSGIQTPHMAVETFLDMLLNEFIQVRTVPLPNNSTDTKINQSF